MKKCSKCLLEKELCCFYKQGNQCKECKKENQRNYNKNNKENISKVKKSYYDNNKEKLKIYKKDYYNINKEKYLAVQKEYRINNKYVINEKYKLRLKEDNFFKLKCTLRKMNTRSSKNKFRKNSKTEIILGCSFKDFKIYLESKFEAWMNWDNYGKYNGKFSYGWDIDHIKPLYSAINEMDLLRLNHFTNLQPLCSKTNRDIKKAQPFG